MSVKLVETTDDLFNANLMDQKRRAYEGHLIAGFLKVNDFPGLFEPFTVEPVPFCRLTSRL